MFLLPSFRSFPSFFSSSQTCASLSTFFFILTRTAERCDKRVSDILRILMPSRVKYLVEISVQKRGSATKYRERRILSRVKLGSREITLKRSSRIRMARIHLYAKKQSSCSARSISQIVVLSSAKKTLRFNFCIPYIHSKLGKKNKK